MTRSKIHHIIYVFSLLWLAASIPVSNFGMSIGGIVLAINWFLEWNWKEKWQRLKENRSVWIFMGVVFVFLIGLIHTDNWAAGMTNLLSKLPLIYAPLVMATSKELDKNSILLVIFGFIISTCVASIITVIYYFTTPFINDMREISLFISHIRFSLCLNLAIVLTIYLILKANISRWLKCILAGMTLWYIAYLFFAQTLTGIIILFILGLFFVIHTIATSKNPRVRIPLLSIILPLIIILATYTGIITYQYFHVSEKEKEITEVVTKKGYDYTFDLSSNVENGHIIGMYVCEPELEAFWWVRSKVPYPEIKETLIRYLNSKGWRKDGEAVMRLTDKDVVNIEHHIANADYAQRFGLKRALYPTFFSLSLYYRYHEISNSSLMERVELWSAASKAFQQHWLLGVGVGDHKAAIDEQLQLKGSQIASKQNRGAHNQFLTFGLMSGILMIAYFIFSLFYPFIRMKDKITLVYIGFFIILFCSMFTEDTLETSAGMTLFAFFNAFLLYVFNKKKLEDVTSEVQSEN